MSARSRAVSSPATPWISDALRTTVLGLPLAVRRVTLRRMGSETWRSMGDALLEAAPGDTFALQAVDKRGRVVVAGAFVVPDHRVERFSIEPLKTIAAQS